MSSSKFSKKFAQEAQCPLCFSFCFSCFRSNQRCFSASRRSRLLLLCSVFICSRWAASACWDLVPIPACHKSSGFTSGRLISLAVGNLRQHRTIRRLKFTAATATPNAPPTKAPPAVIAPSRQIALPQSADVPSVLSYFRFRQNRFPHPRQKRPGNM